MRTVDQSNLHQLEALCTQEQPPAAMSICPLHVDCRGVCAAIANSDFDAAKTLYCKSVPLPHVLCRLCVQPCQSACVRAQAGGPLALRGLEEAAMALGQLRSKRLFLPKRDHSAAVVGGGVCGLSAALEMAKKGFRVSLWEQSPILGGRAREWAPVPEEAWQKDLDSFAPYPVEFHLGERAPETDALAAQFDAVFLAWGDGEVVSVDPQTFQTDRPKVFAGGGAIEGERKSALQSMADGKRAAISIDRFVKQVSLLSGRETEGSYPTTLHTNVARYEESCPRALPPFDREQAVEEASRCIDCKCLECVHACAFLQHFKSYPRKYVREVYNNLSIAMGTRHANTMINSCSLCGQCAAICPNGLDVGAIMKDARQIMVESKKMPQSTFEFALLDMEYSNSGDCFFRAHQPGRAQSRYVFFPGCQLPASAPEIVRAAYLDLTERLEGGVGLLLGCCGVIADWAGQEELYAREVKKLQKAWEELGRPVIITACPTCHQTLRREFARDCCVGIWDILLEKGLPTGFQKLSGKLILHDACGARNQPQVQQAVREVVAQMGLELEAHNYTGDAAGCCGFGGLTQFANPAVADAAARLWADDPHARYLTYCMNCRDRFTKQGAQAVHLLELIYGGGKPHQVPGYSLRRDNREKLKRTMREELWNEKLSPSPSCVSLHYDGEVGGLLESRMILESDIRAVIEAAEGSGRKILHRASGCFIASRRVGNVTFWVYYRPWKDGFHIDKVYSHRMQIKGE